ncbi:unnamed protein product [Ophioblennius macclurei]
MTSPPAEQQKRTVPHSSLEKFSQRCLPAAVNAFLFGKSNASRWVHLVVGALFGAVSGAVLYLGIAHNLPLTFDQKLIAGSAFTGVSVILGAFSSTFRCSALLVLPSMLGARGRSYLMVLLLSVLYSGPMANIQRNAEASAMSVSCNLDLQVRHGRLLWREAIKPFILVTTELVKDQTGFELETRSVNDKFQGLRDELVREYGYDGFSPGHDDGNTTQKQFASKTLRQCDGVVQEGIDRCVGWFRARWRACMAAIPVPVINHLLCFSMTFSFLCDVLRVMTPWCRDNVPVEGNFGPLYDQLNSSVNLLSREFRAQLQVEEEENQEILDGNLVDQVFTLSVSESLKTLTKTSQKILEVFQLVLSFTFISVFLQAFLYLRKYKKDIRFDNVYVTTYFKQIDARRRRAGKRWLLPLKKSEKKVFIYPCSPRIHSDEFNQVMSGMFQVITIVMLSLVLLAVDYVLFHSLDILRRHTINQFNITSSHHVDIRVDGDTLMGNLLRKTISAFNSSSNLEVITDNLECAPKVSRLPDQVYVNCVACAAAMALFSCLQVYTNRLRRVIAAFYFRKREKKRILFLYNLQVHKRINFIEENQSDDKKQKTKSVFMRLFGLCRRRMSRR